MFVSNYQLATILNVMAGYVITYETWDMVFLYTGVLMLIGAGALKLMFIYHPLQSVAIAADREVEEQSVQTET